MTRVSYFTEETMPQDLAPLLLTRGRMINLFRVLPHAPTVAPGFLAMGDALRRQSALDPKLRELVILRVGAISSAGYEVYQHSRIARELGMSEAAIAAATRVGAEDGLDDFERLVLRFTDAVTLEVKAPEPLYRAVADALSERQMAELVLNIGYYTMVCRFLENIELDIDSGGEA